MEKKPKPGINEMLMLQTSLIDLLPEDLDVELIGISAPQIPLVMVKRGHDVLLKVTPMKAGRYRAVFTADETVRIREATLYFSELPALTHAIIGRIQVVRAAVGLARHPQRLYLLAGRLLK